MNIFAYTILLVNLTFVFGNVSVNKPNILFLLADDLGWNDVGFHGSSQIESPNLDSLASEGIILNNYYVLPLCTPSRVALLTGRHPVTVGLQYRVIGPGQRSGIPLEFRLMPEYVNELGYESHMVGKWHLGFFHKNYTPSYRGFKSFYGFYNGKNDYFDHRDHETFSVDWWGLDWRLDLAAGESHTPLPLEFGNYSSRAMANRVNSLIDAHNFDSKPLFLYVSFQATHVANDDDPIQCPSETEYEFPNIWDVKRRKYAGMVKELDSAVGKIVGKLREIDQLENTLIVFSTDNGASPNGYENNWGNNFPLRAGKGYFYEGGTRGVAFVKGEMFKSRSGEVSNDLMHISDWLPTLYDAAGGNSKLYLSDLGSYSMFDLLTGKNLTSPRTDVLVNLDPYTDSKGIKVGNFKYLRNPEDNTDGTYDSWYQAPGPRPNTNETLTPNSTPSQVYCGPIPTDIDLTCHSNVSGLNECLFDLRNDPCEFYNLIDDPNYDEQKETIRERLQYWESVQVTPIYPGVDLLADPSRFNYIWKPWTDDPRIPPSGQITP